MRNEDSANCSAPASVISGALARQIERLLDGKSNSLGFTFTTPASSIECCIFCSTPVAPCLLDSGRSFDAEIEVDDQGVTRVDLTRAHLCAESQRFEEFLRSPAEPPEELEEEPSQGLEEEPPEGTGWEEGPED